MSKCKQFKPEITFSEYPEKEIKKRGGEKIKWYMNKGKVRILQYYFRHCQTIIQLPY